MIRALNIKLLRFIKRRVISRWIILFIDLSIVVFGFITAYALRFNFLVPQAIEELMSKQLFFVVTVFFTGFLIFRPYAGIIRFSSIEDLTRIVWAVLLSGSILMISLAINTLFAPLDFFRMPLSVTIILIVMVLTLMSGLRLLIKGFYALITKDIRSRKNVLIYGAGQMGLVTKQVLLRENRNHFQIIGFIDDDPYKRNKQLEGLFIYHSQAIDEDFLTRKNIEEVIIAAVNITSENKQTLTDVCLSVGVKVRVVPPMLHWINGELTADQINNVKIEDLLGRPPIILNNPKVYDQINKKVVLVTGAAGSIGSEIARQLLPAKPSVLLVLDQSESQLHELTLELRERKNEYTSDGLDELKIIPILMDVTDKAKVTNVFSTYKPDFVYHAAAYKHVPLMEDHPYQAIRVNVLGTKIVSDLASKFKSDTFVMISTDKAVNPTNVMGASKRIAEMYCQSFSAKTSTKFIITRFGNVLGSNGSVIPLFRRQIKKGGPLTVTHPDIVRYFMTIPEACDLVLEAGAMGSGGEVYVFDMGQPIKIMDLAKQMIRLSGLTENKDITIKITGLRPGEKTFEELLSDGEKTLATHHPKIKIARLRTVDHDSLLQYVEQLRDAIKNSDNNELVGVMKQIVPEYKSANSVYNKLDAKLANLESS